MMKVKPGLEGIVAAETGISLVDGEKGRLIYRGCRAEELAGARSFEEVAHLLWKGRLPDTAERERERRRWAEARVVPAFLQELIAGIPRETAMMDVIRTAVSALGSPSFEGPPTEEQAIRIASLLPTIIALRLHHLKGSEVPKPRPDLSHAAHYLYLLQGKVPAPAHVRALEAYFVLTAEHGMNASTFTARVVTSTRSDLISAIAAAIGALKGPLHGGAPSGVESMLDEIGTEERIEPWIREQLAKGDRLMGFGHRIYKTEDPRAAALRDIAVRLAAEEPWFRLAVQVEKEALRLLEEYKPGRRIRTNVEYYAAAIFRAVGLPRELYTATFLCSRVVGWAAHAMEQAAHNRLIRPDSVYTGPVPR
jgi:citrate synthase